MRKGLVKRLALKITSGRFIFTIVVAYVFCYMSITGALPTDKITEIMMIVLYAYFTRSDRTTSSLSEDEGKESNQKKYFSGPTGPM